MIMSNLDKWRGKADKMLAAPVKRQRKLNTVAGKVEDRFEAILAARRRGMPWADIAKALEDGGPVKVDAVESAFKRICREKGITPPGQRRAVIELASTMASPPVPAAPQQTLFGDVPERWVDNGE